MRIALKIEEEFAAAPDDDGRQFCRFLYLSQFLSVLGKLVALSCLVPDILEAIVERRQPARIRSQGGIVR